MPLPADIQEIFFDTLTGEKTLSAFEEWLYADKRLETILSAEDYLALISYGYKSDTAEKWLYKLFEKHIDRAEFEKRRIRKLLTKALERNKELPHLLVVFYDLYCHGYSFMDNLGLGYGLAVQVPYSLAESWQELTTEQQENLLNSFYPGLEKEIQKTISWIDNGKIVFTGIKDGDNIYQYIDNRTEEERAPTSYKIAAAEAGKNGEKTSSLLKNTAAKPWWKFW